VVYDPAIIVTHLDDGNAFTNSAAEAEIARAREIFMQKHAGYLASRPGRGERAQVFARVADDTQKRVLFLEDTVPLRMIGSGFVRSNDLVKVMASMGYAVTVYPLNGCPFDPAAVYADMPDTVEVMYDQSVEQLQPFLELRQEYYDAIWVARTHNLNAIRPVLEGAISRYGSLPRIVLDTEAIASLRDADHAALEGRTFDVGAAVKQEFINGEFCDQIVAVSESEAATLRDLGLDDVNVIGHMRALRPTPRLFAQRAGMLFVGAIHRMDSPNYDSLCWFIDEILPLIERELGWQTRLTVAGYTGPDVSLDRFRSHSRVTLRGAVQDLEPLYDSHLGFVAPTRFAAGTPYKVYEASSFGLPVVATELLRQQLNWVAERELLTAGVNDPATFARQVISLHRDPITWHNLREASLARLELENNRKDYSAAIARALWLSPIVG
jgi:glycosyltransferase involved in cell wall biosynthesis